MLETRTRVAAPAAAIPGWRFWVPLAVQVLIVLAVPAPKLAAYAVGTPVVLRTVPVDPVDLMRGRYAMLGYEVGREAAARGLPNGPVYVTLAPGEPAWRAGHGRADGLRSGRGARLSWLPGKRCAIKRAR